MISAVEAIHLLRREGSRRKPEHRGRVVASRGFAALDALKAAIDPNGRAATLWEGLYGSLGEHWIHPMEWFPVLSGRIAERSSQRMGVPSLAFRVCLCWWLDSFSAALAQGWKEERYPSPLILPSTGAWKLSNDPAWVVDLVGQLNKFVPSILARPSCTAEEVAHWTTTIAPMELRTGWLALRWCVVSGSFSSNQEDPDPSTRRIVSVN